MAHIMTKRGSIDNVITYEHYCDSAADLANIPSEEMSLGSVAIVVNGQLGGIEVYIANSNKQWSAVASVGGSASSEDVAAAVENYFEDHPELISTIEDGSINYDKLNSDLKQSIDALSSLQDSVNTLNSRATVNNFSALANTTADRVLVLNNDSPFGIGGPVWFEKHSGWTSEGYLNKDRVKLFPVPSQGPIPESNASYSELMRIIRSYVGRTDIVHTDNADPSNLGLYAANCRKNANNKYEMDCSDFVCAVLQGITFENSRYNRFIDSTNSAGEPINAAENRLGEHIGSNIFPRSASTVTKTEGGLLSGELAQWFAERRRLFKIPSNPEEAMQTLRLGDIIFQSWPNSNPHYGSIGHCMIYIGCGNTLECTIAECSSTSSSMAFEGTAVRLRRAGFVSQLTNQTEPWTYFARPDYSGFGFKFNNIIPRGGGYIIKPQLIPGFDFRIAKTESSNIIQGRSQTATLLNYAYDPEYYPVIPGSKVNFIGNVRSPRDITYVCKVLEYDNKGNYIPRSDASPTRTAIVDNYGAHEGTLTANTYFIRISFGYFDSAGVKFWISEMDDCQVLVTPPTT